MLAARTSSGDSGTNSPGRRRSSSGGVLSAEAQPRRVLTWSRHRTALEEESAAATASSGVWGALLGADGGARAALRGDCASVGSSSASDLCLREEYVSEKHLSLLRVRSAQSVFTHVYLADASARGTHVNGDLVHHATRQLRSGDLLELRSADASAAVTLRYSTNADDLHAAATAAATAAAAAKEAAAANRWGGGRRRRASAAPAAATERRRGRRQPPPTPATPTEPPSEPQGGWGSGRRRLTRPGAGGAPPTPSTAPPPAEPAAPAPPLVAGASRDWSQGRVPRPKRAPPTLSGSPPMSDGDDDDGEYKRRAAAPPSSAPSSHTTLESDALSESDAELKRMWLVLTTLTELYSIALAAMCAALLALCHLAFVCVYAYALRAADAAAGDDVLRSDDALRAAELGRRATYAELAAQLPAALVGVSAARLAIGAGCRAPSILTAERGAQPLRHRAVAVVALSALAPGKPPPFTSCALPPRRRMRRRRRRRCRRRRRRGRRCGRRRARRPAPPSRRRRSRRCRRRRPRRCRRRSPPPPPPTFVRLGGHTQYSWRFSQS